MARKVIIDRCEALRRTGYVRPKLPDQVHSRCLGWVLETKANGPDTRVVLSKISIVHMLKLAKFPIRLVLSIIVQLGRPLRHSMCTIPRYYFTFIDFGSFTDYS